MIMKNKCLIIAIFLIIAAFAPLSAQDAIDDTILTLEKCKELTLKNNPRIAASISGASAQRNRLSQTKAAYMPQIGASAGYSRSANQSALVNGDWLSASDNYNSSISASQLIYDFGKTGLTSDIQKNTYYASLQDSESVMNDTIFQLTQVYIAVLASREQRDVFIQSVERYEEQLKRAQAFYNVGSRPRIDVTTAQVDLNNAKLNLIQAENTLKIARQRLLNIMGVYDRPADFELQKQMNLERYDIELEQALKQAFESRPDLASSKLRLESARQNVKLSQTGFTPELNANGSYGWTGNDFPLYDRWSFGASVSLPIFNGFSTVNKVKENKNNLNTAYYNLTDAQQSALLDVRTSYYKLQDADSRIPVAELSKQAAEESFKLAVGRYTVGVGNYIEVKDAEVSLSSARLNYISAVYDYNLAIADLKRAMGSR